MSDDDGQINTLAPLTYAAVASSHGQKRLDRLRRRQRYLAERLRTGASTLAYDRSEESALRWVLAKVHELRDRLDRVCAIAAERAAPEVSAELHRLAAEQPDDIARRAESRAAE